ncbi:MAG: shikimate kinase [Armatimonadetes bacterium]|nr:shikimate kinase [Armatimonadota bacterium]
MVLVGFMGSGKSTLARRLGRRLGLPAIDLDAEVEAWAAASIPTLFSDFGEPVFRSLEAAVVQSVTHGPAAVVATGGGVLGRPASRSALRASGFVVYLSAPIDVLADRVAEGKGRPMVIPGEDRLAKMRQLLAERDAVYRAAADLEVDTSAGTVAGAAALVAERYRRACVEWERGHG